MKLLFTFFIFFTVHLGIAQNDFIILNKDTIKCEILENGLDTISYISFRDGKFYRITENITAIDSQYLAVENKIDLIHFSQNLGCEFSTQDLIGKLDFSSKSPHIKLARDFSVSQVAYKNVIDTTNNRIYWFGLDFSKVKIRLGKAPRTQYSELFFLDCNDFMLSETGITYFRNHFNLIVDTGIVINRNNRINLLSTYNKNSQKIPLDSMRMVLMNFKTIHKGIGLIIFVTDINKESESITYYPTFFDLKSKTVLLCFKETAKSGGIGMASHWTKPIIETLDYLIKKEGWKKRYL